MDRRKVLIIDDEIDLCLLLKSYFQRNNFDVFISHTVSEGLKTLDEQKPQLLFIDNNLPDGTGWESVPDIAQKHPGIHISLISAYHPQAPQMPEGTRYNILEKPISLADIDRLLKTELP